MKRVLKGRAFLSTGTRRPLAILVASLPLLLGACDDKKVGEALEKAQEANAYSSQECAPSIPASSAASRIPHPNKPTFCVALVLACNYCEYEANGAFKSSGASVCGICAGWDTP